MNNFESLVGAGRFTKTLQKHFYKLDIFSHKHDKMFFLPFPSAFHYIFWSLFCFCLLTILYFVGCQNVWSGNIWYNDTSFKDICS